jgi:Flp pilus assembly protein TadD
MDGATTATGDYQLQIIAGNGAIPTKRLTAEMLVPYEMLLAGKIAEGVEAYRKIKKDTPQNVAVGEDRLNNLGYALVRQGNLPAAIALLKLNVEFYPNSWNTYDSLAEAYMNSGEKELAIANYKKSLELNPQNANGREMLKKLEQ